MQSLGPMNVGVIGLGAGTLATYARPIDKYTFYEINPAVLKIAETEFTFLKFCLAPKEIVMGDARLSMETGPSRQFDVLAVDAFSGDAIPVHLLTREANALYWRHLKPDGILAVHVSNRHLSLAPAVALPAYDSATGLNRHWCVLWPLAGHAPHLGAIQRDLETLSAPTSSVQAITSLVMAPKPGAVSTGMQNRSGFDRIYVAGRASVDWGQFVETSDLLLVPDVIPGGMEDGSVQTDRVNITGAGAPSRVEPKSALDEDLGPTVLPRQVWLG